MPTTHHPDAATLMSYAAGSLPEALSAVVSTHLMVCEQCRKSVRDMEDIGAALLALESADTEPPANADHSAGRDFDIAEVLATETATSDAAEPRELERLLGETDPVTRLTGLPLEDIAWKRLGWGVWHYPVQLRGENAGDLRLIKVQKGQAMPEHGHGGSELTLVLHGSYSDEMGTYRAGDIADLDDSVEHRPVADMETGCICLIAHDRRLKFTGMVGRLIQPIVGI